MFEPKYIGIYQFPNNLLKELIISRHKVLAQKNPHYQNSFQEIETMLKRHHTQLRKNWPQQTDKQIIQKVLTELELTNYNFKTQIQEKRYQKQPLRHSSDFIIEKRQASCLPYHYKRFKRSLNKFQLSCSQKKQKLHWKNISNTHSNGEKINKEYRFSPVRRPLIRPLKRN